MDAVSRAQGWPFVTVAISCKDDEARIEACVRRALGQDYPKDRLEVLVADAMSMDASREIVLRIQKEDPRVRLLDNSARTRAAALNVIIREGRGEIFVPMDPSDEHARTHVAKCVDALTSSPADHLAIVPRTAGRTLVERALSAVSATRLAFAAGTELARGSEPIPALLGAIRKNVFDRVGLFDPGTRCEEDVELSQRITRSGGALTVRRDIVVHRSQASSFKDLFRRQYQLGRSRARRTVKTRRVGSVRELAPLAFVVGGGALLATSSIQPFTAVAVALYALKTGTAALRVGRDEGIVTVPIAWVAYPVMHLAHGVGYGTGLVRSVVRPDWSKDSPNEPTTTMDPPPASLY
jgi:succinoglycan biosynthesis protein ExoA